MFFCCWWKLYPFILRMFCRGLMCLWPLGNNWIGLSAAEEMKNTPEPLVCSISFLPWCFYGWVDKRNEEAEQSERELLANGLERTWVCVCVCVCLCVCVLVHAYLPECLCHLVYFNMPQSQTDLGLVQFLPYDGSHYSSGSQLWLKSFSHNGPAWLCLTQGQLSNQRFRREDVFNQAHSSSTLQVMRQGMSWAAPCMNAGVNHIQ